MDDMKSTKNQTAEAQKPLYQVVTEGLASISPISEVDGTELRRMSEAFPPGGLPSLYVVTAKGLVPAARFIQTNDLVVKSNGWKQRPNGDIWDSDGMHARPVLYAVKGGWMVAGIRTPDELQAITDLSRSLVGRE